MTFSLRRIKNRLWNRCRDTVLRRKELLEQRFFPVHFKERHELGYWSFRAKEEGQLKNAHYEFFFTVFFGLSPDFYGGKKLLDVGCGPRGSLEWARNAACRVGLDPLVNEYRPLGIDRHAMTYVDAASESIPFPAAHFDVVSVFNALDHVHDVKASLVELARVLCPGGTLLIITEVDHPPTPTEPVELPKDFLNELAVAFTIEDQKRFEIGNHDIYGQLRADKRFDSGNSNQRSSVITARLTKRHVSGVK